MEQKGTPAGNKPFSAVGHTPALEPDCLSSNGSDFTSWLCGLDQVTLPL